jgi:hypothetical protein
MKVIYTDEALADLDGILSFIASNFSPRMGEVGSALVNGHHQTVC